MTQHLSTVLLIMLLHGCQFNDNPDPLEPINRPIYVFNTAVDNAIISPLTEAYVHTIPSPMQLGIHNLSNIVNDVKTIPMQLAVGNPTKSADNASRILINSILSFGGLFDVAGDFGANNHKISMADVGRSYGLQPIFVVMPLMGPTTSFDLVATAGQSIALKHSLNRKQNLALTSLMVLDARAQLLTYQNIIDNKRDPYLYVRAATMQTQQGDVFEAPSDL